MSEWMVGNHVVLVEDPNVTGYITSIEWDQVLQRYWVFVELDVPAYVMSTEHPDERVVCLDKNVRVIHP